MKAPKYKKFKKIIIMKIRPTPSPKNGYTQLI